jgi:hypothetical protein
MIRDCRENKPDGWLYLVTHYVPVASRLLEHYFPSDSNLVVRVLPALHDPALPLFAAPGPGTEREFVAALRNVILQIAEKHNRPVEHEQTLDLETLTAALAPFTATERQFVWLEAMNYSDETAALLMNLEPSTIRKSRDRADELLREKLDRWSKGLIRNHGLALGRLVAGLRGTSCLPAGAFLDTIDGRITWSRRKDYESHLTACWHCVDHFCRIREADHTLRHAAPLRSEAAGPYLRILGLPEPKKTFWKKIFS